MTTTKSRLIEDAVLAYARANAAQTTMSIIREIEESILHDH